MPSRLPSLNALRAFEATARHGSVAAAADELAVTAGAVSRQIKALEQDLGVGLFERDGRGLRLTAAGTQCFDGLRPAFEQMQRTVARMRRPRRRDDLLVATEPLFAATWLVPRLDRFRALVPSLDVTIDGTVRRSEPTHASTALVIDYGRLDELPGMVSSKLIEEEIFPVACPALAAGLADPADLAQVALLHYDSAPRYWDWPDWSAWLADLGVDGVDADRGPRFVAGTLVMEAVRDGQGVALVCTSLAHDDLAAGRLVRPFEAALATDCGYYLMYAEGRAERPEVGAFRSWLRDELAESFPDRLVMRL